MLGRECVPKRVPSLQCYGYPLEQEHGLVLLLGCLCDSSSHFGDKLDCFIVPRPPVSIAIGANWWVFVSSWYFAVLLSAAWFAAAGAVIAASAMYELA